MTRIVRWLWAVCALAATAAMSAPPAPVARFSDFRYEGSEPAYGGRPAAPGTYLNPILAGSYADPSIIRVGRDYYLVNSSFVLFPGLPIFHSRDLVHWRRIGAGLTRPTQMSLDGRSTWEGLYAPDLEYHAGRFYLLGTCYRCGGNFIMTARDPAGPWSDPIWLPFEGIDPSLFVDRDGRAYVLNNGPPPGGARYDGHRAIWVQEIALDTLALVGPRTVLVDGGGDLAAKPFWIEGPHLLRHGDDYVLIAAEGGTKEAHHEVAFRATTLRGPYVPAPAPILSQIGLDPKRPYPIVQAGHADMVATPAGDWWSVFLASRPYGPGELAFNSGRETFLLPVTWREGWPVILPPGRAVPYRVAGPKLPRVAGAAPTGGDYVFADRFAGKTLDPRWSWLRAPAEGWSAGGGVLSLAAGERGLTGHGKVAFLALRQAHRRIDAMVTVAFAPAGARDTAGLALFQDEARNFVLGLAAAPGGGREVRLSRHADPRDPEDGVALATAPLPDAGPVRLRVAVDGPVARFAYDADGKGWRPIGGQQDARLLSVERSNGFSGSLVGPYAVAPR